METINKVRMISKRITLVSAIILFAGTLSATNITEEANPSMANMPVFYLTFIVFFALFLTRILVTHVSKKAHSLKSEKYFVHPKHKHAHYKKVIRKTA